MGVFWGPLECQEGVSGSSKNSRKKGLLSQSSTEWMQRE